MEITQKSKLTNEEIDKIIELLRSPDNNNRQLGVVLALSQDMDIEVLVDGILNKCWFWDSYNKCITQNGDNALPILNYISFGLKYTILIIVQIY